MKTFEKRAKDKKIWILKEREMLIDLFTSQKKRSIMKSGS